MCRNFYVWRGGSRALAQSDKGQCFSEVSHGDMGGHDPYDFFVLVMPLVKAVPRINIQPH